MYDNIPMEKKVDILIAASPLGHLSKNAVTMWIGWDGKLVYMSGIVVGEVEWMRDYIKPDFKQSYWNNFISLLFPRKKDERVEYQVIDVFGQRWRGRAMKGMAGQFVRQKELP